MNLRKYEIASQIKNAAKKTIVAGSKHSRNYYAIVVVKNKLKMLARGEYGRRIIERLESRRKLNPAQKLIVVMKVLRKLKRKPTDMQKKAMDRILDELIKGVLRNEK